MSVFDKFLSAIRLNDDYDDEEDFFDEEDEEETKPRKRFLHKLEEEDEEEETEGTSSASFKSSFSRNTTGKTNTSSQAASSKMSHISSTASSKVTPMRKKTGVQNMEVCVIKPASMEDTREIADTLLAGCTVVLNLEGMDMDIAQRIIDFCCGSCYCMNGSLQKVSNYIFIVTPSSVEISGDIQDILSGAFDLPNIRTDF